MPIQTDLSVSPYFDDYQESKNYHQVLFKPGVALQTRELNVLQSMLQKQIERFGDNVFTKGTIITGCNFQYFNNYPYVKINDLQNDGLAALVTNYVGLYANGNGSTHSNLVSYIMTANSGYVSQSPYLNTLYIRYLNSGNTGTETAYAPGDVLTIYDSNVSIWQVNVPIGGTAGGIANTDSVVFLSSIAISGNTLSISPNNVVYVGASVAASTVRAIVTSVNTTAIANTTIVNLAPFSNTSTNDMSNTNITSSYWTFANGAAITFANSVTNTTSFTTGTITSIIGSGAAAVPVTDSTGKITQIVMTSQGNGYAIAPYATVKASNSSASVSAITALPASAMTAQNYKCQVTVANTSASGSSAPAGKAYAFGVSQGIIYQKGYFLYVNPQTVVVSPYSNVPDQLVVGFNTNESIINSNIDTSLLDNATGTYNTLAPGADRLQLVPTLVVLSSAAAASNSAFFPITAFSGGAPYLQNQQTQYSTIGQAMAARTYETSGNFVTDPFQLTTKVSALDSTNYPNNATTQSQYFTATIDPGEGFISGYRVKTYTNYYLNVAQGVTTSTLSNTSINLNYGNYLVVNEIGGTIPYTTGDYITFYDTAKGYITNGLYATVNTTPQGNAIGTARVRLVTPVNGVPGTNTAQSRVYIYDINMNPGTNLQNAKSIYYSNTASIVGSTVGIADIVLTPPVNATGANIATVVNSAASYMLFPVGANSTQSVSSIVMNTKGLFNSSNGLVVNAAPTGGTAATLTLTLASGYTFPYGNNAVLSDAQLSGITLTFNSSNAQAYANLSGVAFIANSATNVLIVNTTATPSGTTSALSAGDYLKIYMDTSTTTGPAGNTIIKRVTSIINSTAVALDTAPAFTNNFSNAVLFFPRYVPVPLNGRLLGDRSANVNATGNILTVKLSANLTTNTANLACNGFIADATLQVPLVFAPSTSTSKLPVRNSTVVLNMSNNSFANNGPWPLGVPDIFRLKKVYKDVNTNIINAGSLVSANVANSATIPSTWVDVTNQFFINHNQNSDYYDIGYLNVKPNSSLFVGPGDALVVMFDYFTGSGGVVTRSSYPVNDANSFSVLTKSTTACHTLEIPEMFDSQGRYYDLIDYIDFRPKVTNTAVLNTVGNNQLSTINPVDFGALQTVITYGNTGTSSTTVNSIPSTANLVVGMYVISNNGNVPVGTKIASIINSSAITLSSAATPAGNTQLTFVGDIVKFGSSLGNYTFPIDGASFTSTTTFYQGRVDRVVVDSSGIIKSLPGVAGVDNLVAPAEPIDSLTINLLYIPPYPSMPDMKDSNITSIIDRGIGSQKYTNQRQTFHTVSVPSLSTSQISSYQPAAYTMKDIGVLERRIKALESYVSLSQLEQAASKLAIPSSINGAINRFKYGFFADAFLTSAYSDLQNPEYSATIINNEVIAKQTLNNIEFGYNLAYSAPTGSTANVTGIFLTLPYVENSILSQPNATNGAITTTGYTPPPSPPPPPPPRYYGTLVSNPTSFTLITKVDTSSGGAANSSQGSNYSVGPSTTPLLGTVPGSFGPGGDHVGVADKSVPAVINLGSASGTVFTAPYPLVKMQ